jgi:hypothetical protein
LPWQPSSLSEIEHKAWRLIEKSPAPGKHAARNAVFHIERAYAIEGVDPEMAVFRSITAEEEAVRAVFHALQRHRYPNARQLDWTDHKHKAAVVPFLRAVADLIPKTGFPPPEVRWEKNKNGEDVLRVRIKIPSPDGSGFLWLYPEPPLDFNLEIDGKRHDFRPEIDALLTNAQVAKFAKFVRDRANQRNRFLYASAQGIPIVAGNIRKDLDATRGRVIAELVVFLLIDTVKTQQQFVQQALDAFICLMGLITDEAAT